MIELSQFDVSSPVSCMVAVIVPWTRSCPCCRARPLSSPSAAGERGARRRAWAGRDLDRYGARIIIVCRFIPGGRTAVTLTCGMIRSLQAAELHHRDRLRKRHLGRLRVLYRAPRRQGVEDGPWAGLLLALGAALAVSAWPRCCVVSAPGACSDGSGPAARAA